MRILHKAQPSEPEIDLAGMGDNVGLCESHVLVLATPVDVTDCAGPISERHVRSANASSIWCVNSIERLHGGFILTFFALFVRTEFPKQMLVQILSGEEV